MRAANMQALTNDLETKYPGMTIYGIGDAAHKLEESDHNEDDTPGVRAEQSDADNNPEHRAIDAMITAGFTAAEAEALVGRVVVDPVCQKRLHYVIWNRHIWEADNGWARRDYKGSNPHTDHAHFSGLASDDENGSGWPVVFADGSAPAPVPPTTGGKTVWSKGDSGKTVAQIQAFFRQVFPAYRHSVTYRPGTLIYVDGVYGDQTVAWVKEFQKRTGLVRDGETGPNTFAKMRQYGYQY